MADYVNFERVKALPTVPLVDTIYFVLPDDVEVGTQYVTGDNGVPVAIGAASAAQQLFAAGLTTAPTTAAMATWLRAPVIESLADYEQVRLVASVLAPNGATLALSIPANLVMLGDLL